MLVVGGLGVVADRNAQSNLATLNLIGNEQLNELNRADSLLNQAMLAMETASNLLMVGQTRQSNEQVEVAANRIERAERRFEKYQAAPRTARDEVLGSAVDENFRAVLDLVKQQHASFEFMDINKCRDFWAHAGKPDVIAGTFLKEPLHSRFVQFAHLLLGINPLTCFRQCIGINVGSNHFGLGGFRAKCL